MAHPGIKFIGALRRWGAESENNLQQLKDWKTEALLAISENKGGDIASGSGNGVVFTRNVSMTTAEWFTVLDEAIQYIEAGVAPRSTTLARII